MKNLTKLIRNQQATSAIEFALMFPILLLFLYGVVEISRYAYFMKKLESTSAQLSNVLGSYFDAADVDPDEIYEAGQKMFEPFDGSNLTIILTTYRKIDPDPASTKVQALIQTRKGPTATSKLAPNGDCGGNDTNPACAVTLGTIQFKENDLVNSVEVFAKYTPTINWKPIILYITQGRTGTLINFAPTLHRQTIYRARYSSFKKN